MSNTKTFERRLLRHFISTLTAAAPQAIIPVLVNELVEERGPFAAKTSVHAVIQRVKSRLKAAKSPTLDVPQQKAFLTWLRRVNESLTPPAARKMAKKIRAKNRSRRHYEVQRQRNKRGYLARECEVYVVKKVLENSAAECTSKQP